MILSCFPHFNIAICYIIYFWPSSGQTDNFNVLNYFTLSMFWFIFLCLQSPFAFEDTVTSKKAKINRYTGSMLKTWIKWLYFSFSPFFKISIIATRLLLRKSIPCTYPSLTPSGFSVCACYLCLMMSQMKGHFFKRTVCQMGLETEFE